ncbi:MAG: PQQ-binding-like beta-propeller repeat protein, partial [Vicinamibacterales bacterium]
MLALPVVAGAQSPPSAASLFPVRTQWSVTIDAGLGGRPVFDGAVAYVPLGGDRLAAYDLIRGDQRWNIPHEPPSAMVAAEGALFLVTRSTLAALDADEGRTLWERPLEAPLTAPPVVLSGWLIV